MFLLSLHFFAFDGSSFLSHFQNPPIFTAKNGTDRHSPPQSLLDVQEVGWIILNHHFQVLFGNPFFQEDPDKHS